MKKKLNFSEKFFKILDHNKTFILFFLLFSIIYILNFEDYTKTFATDYQVRYKSYGLRIIDQISNMDFSSNFLMWGDKNHHAYFNNYYIPQLITGLLLKISTNEYVFSIISNILNMLLLFISISNYFNVLNLKKKNQILTIFFIFFFVYLANWVWVFWKLAEIYFLFVFSLVFYFLAKGIENKKTNFILISLFFVFISLITKPQGFAVIPFFICSVILLYYKKLDFFKSIVLLLLCYFIFFPLLIFTVMKLDQSNMFAYFYIDGKINGIILYKYEDFLNQFNLSNNNLTELLYYYFLIIKKTVYQLTFLRETYSIRHNIFLIPYTLVLYFFLIINLDYLIKNYNMFFKLTVLICIFSILLQSSLGMSGEPNRTVLFNLIPLYILASISFHRWVKIIYNS